MVPPWLDWGGSGPLLHLGHANGFPPASYRKLVGGLTTSFHVVSMSARPLWPELANEAPTFTDWTTLADDLAAELSRRGHSGILGMGHSLGGVITLLAAVRHPGLFRTVVAVDPVLFTGTFSFSWSLIKRLGLARRTTIVRGALRRRELWTSYDQVRAAFAAKPFFANWDRECLEDYIREGFAPRPEGNVALRYAKAWEAQIFATTPHDVWRSLRQLRIPVLFLRGGNSQAFTRPALERARRLMPSSTTAEIAGTSHLVPFEQPLAVAACAAEHLTKNAALDLSPHGC